MSEPIRRAQNCIFYTPWWRFRAGKQFHNWSAAYELGTLGTSS